VKRGVCFIAGFLTVALGGETFLGCHREGDCGGDLTDLPAVTSYVVVEASALFEAWLDAEVIVSVDEQDETVVTIVAIDGALREYRVKAR
jgi:hypothetical protein